MKRTEIIPQNRLNCNVGLSTLAAVGVDFTLPMQRAKRPYTTGWPSYRPDLATVARHVAGGGNLGVHVKGYTHGRALAYLLSLIHISEPTRPY